MNWKAYEEVNFSDQYIMRWVREGDEYVNRITKEMMEDFKAVVRQQEKELTNAGHMIGVLREYISDLEKGLDSSIKLNKAQAERNQ